jgi:hypothetical protein
MDHIPPHLGVMGAHFYHFLGHIPQARRSLQRGIPGLIDRVPGPVVSGWVVSQASYTVYWPPPAPWVQGRAGMGKVLTD